MPVFLLVMVLSFQCSAVGKQSLHLVQTSDTAKQSDHLSEVDSLTLSVLESHNELLDPHSFFYPFTFRPSDSVAVQLRSMIPRSISSVSSNEEEFFPSITQWVHTRWMHDSFNSIAQKANSIEILNRAANGERFTCVEYAKVLTDILVSHGFAARMVGLSRRNISNPRLGARHVVTEVWSCLYRKWIMLDGQFGSYAIRNGIPLHVSELQESLRLQDSSVTLHISSINGFLKRHLWDKGDYLDMLRNLDSFVDIPYVIENKVGLLMLVPTDRNEPLLFQGQVISNTQYTKKQSDLYASLGDVHMDLSFNANGEPPSRALLHPTYTVITSTAYPFTRYLEVSIDGGPWKRVNEHRTQWALHRGENSIATRTVCYSGCTTKPASLVVYYGLRNDAREARRRWLQDSLRQLKALPKKNSKPAATEDW